ncbi:MAG TPA: tetratricopeptide repeat protein, partial [Verrucomicrobiota bacterium]|nr:tetratricopeptide repeat protein [Verrucomicrobiota bacterium]
NRPPGADLFLDHVHLQPEGNYLLAKRFAEQIIAHLGNPPGPTYWLSLDACLERLGWSAFAEVRLWNQIKTLTERPPFSHQSNAELRNRFLDDRLNEASRAARRKGLAASIGQVQAVVAQHPTDWNVREQLARLLQANRQWSNAATELQQVVAIAPGHVVGWYQLGESLAKAGNPKAALPAYQKALEIRPDFVEARLGLGLSLGEAGQLEAALESIDSALKYSPKNLQAQVNRGIALNALGRFDEAVAEFKRAALDHPDSILPLVRLGDLLSTRKDYGGAVYAYAEAARREPTNAAATHRLAIELSRAGHIPDAVAAFRQALTLQPNFVDARLDLGVALAQQARFAEAIPEFEAALQVQPTNSLALKYLQLAREKLGQNGVR